MNRDQIESAVSLAINPDTSHEDSRDWYAAYGWHLTTEQAGDVCHDAVEYDWLDGTDAAAVRRLLAADTDLSRDEAETIVERAREIREAAESIETLLDEAVDAHGRGDLAACKQALLSAYGQESEHGDAPATQSLAGKLLACKTMHDARRCGYVTVGEFGLPPTAGYIVSPPGCLAAVQAAYDAIEEGDLGPDVLVDVLAAGGHYITEE